MNSRALDLSRPIVIHTDASYRPRNELGGWAARFLNLRQRDSMATLRYGRIEYATGIAYAEMYAIYCALKLLPKRVAWPEIHVFTDSRMCISILANAQKQLDEGSWARSNPANADLMFKTLRLIDTRWVNVRWVKGHEQEVGNCICDAFAKEALRRSIQYVAPVRHKKGAPLSYQVKGYVPSICEDEALNPRQYDLDKAKEATKAKEADREATKIARAKAKAKTRHREERKSL